MIEMIRRMAERRVGLPETCWVDSFRARVTALENALGKCDGRVFHSDDGEVTGYSDVLRFRDHVAGATYATCDLTGDPYQYGNSHGQFELMMCAPTPNAWAPRILSRLGRYTRKNTIEPGEVMDLGDCAPINSRIMGLMFLDPAFRGSHFTLGEGRAGLLLCVGITKPEFDVCRDFGCAPLIRAMKDCGIYPYTDVARDSLIDEAPEVDVVYRRAMGMGMRNVTEGAALPN